MSLKKTAFDMSGFEPWTFWSRVSDVPARAICSNNLKIKDSSEFIYNKTWKVIRPRSASKVSKKDRPPISLHPPFWELRSCRSGLQMEAWPVFDRKYAEGWKKSGRGHCHQACSKETIRTIIKPAFHYTFFPIITYYYNNTINLAYLWNLVSSRASRSLTE